jgi:nitrogen regulatory protein PII
MEQHQRRLLTIITEAALERELVSAFDSLGVRGYTITDARGKGSRGRRQSDWAQEGNIRIEVVCDEAIAERVVTRLREHYYDNFAMILFMHDVQVLRPEKF